jgi:flagellar basal body-associated protein FliL
MDPRPPERPSSEREPTLPPEAGEPATAHPPAADIPPRPAFAPSGLETQDAPSPPRNRGRRLLVIVAAALIILGGGVAAAAFLFMRGSSEELLQLVPASSEVVVTAYLDPSAGQKMNLLTLAHRFPALGSDRDLRERVNTALDEALQGSALTHDDVLPWLGSEVAIVVDFGPNDDVVTTSVLLASTDDAAAEAALGKAMTASLGNEQARDYRDVTMHVFGSGSSLTTYAIVDHVVVISNHAIGLTRVIDVSEGTTPDLADDRDFVDTVSTLPAGKLGLVYVNPTEIVTQALSASGLGAAGGSMPGLDTLRAFRGIGMSLSAQPDGLAIDLTIRLDPSKLDPATREQLDRPVHENATLSFVPAGSYAVATQQGLDTALKQVLDQALSTPQGERLRKRLGVDDALSALTGDMAFEIGPGSGATPVGGAVVLGVTNPDAVQHTLDGLADLALASQQRAGALSPVPGAGDRSREQLTQLGTLQPAPRVAWRSTTYQGTTIRYLDDPSLSGSGFLPAYAVVDGAAMIASSPAEIRKLIDVKGGQPSIMSSSAYTRALAQVPRGSSSFYLDVKGIVSRFAPALPPDVEANIEPIESVVAGGATSSSRVSERIFIVIR